MATSVNLNDFKKKKKGIKMEKADLQKLMNSEGKKPSVRSTGKAVLEMHKMENDEWRVIALDKVIEKVITGYLNDKAMNSEPVQTVYKNDSLTGFMATPESVLMLKNSPDDYNPNHYLILHKRKDRKEPWRLWKR